jgi:hypothetical protein
MVIDSSLNEEARCLAGTSIKYAAACNAVLSALRTRHACRRDEPPHTSGSCLISSSAKEAACSWVGEEAAVTN